MEEFEDSGGYEGDYLCSRCQSEENVRERYSFGVYAGRLCRDCATGYRDHCGIDQPQGRPEELEQLGETYWGEEY